MNLADTLVQSGHSVTLWSSDFFHQEKRHRARVSQDIKISSSLRIILVQSPGYKGNIGLGRLIDHAFLAFNLFRLLRKTKSLPDVAFIGYPPIEFAYVAVKWLKFHDVPTMLDAKDKWPHIFVEPFPKILKPFIRFFLSHYFFLGRRAMRDATALCSMTPNFLAWMRQFSGKENSNFDIVVPLSPINKEEEPESIRKAISWWSERGVKHDKQFRIFFIGSLSQAFDFEPVIFAANRALENGLDWQFVICGDGEKAALIINAFSGISNVIFPGWIDRSKSVALAGMSAIGLAPYRNTDNFTDNMPNKIIDYLCLGKPIASPLYGCVRNLIIEKNVGLTYERTGINHQLFDELVKLFNSPQELDKKSKNATLAYKEYYSGEMVYNKLVQNLENMSSKNTKNFLR